MNFIKNCSKSQFHENMDNGFNISVICVSFDNINPWHVYSFAYDGFNWRDGIRYSYISFCAKSASISLVDFSVDIVASKNKSGKSFKSSLSLFVPSFRFFFNI